VDSDFSKVSVGLFSLLKQPLNELKVAVKLASDSFVRMNKSRPQHSDKSARSWSQESLTSKSPHEVFVTPDQVNGLDLSTSLLKDKVGFLSLAVENCLQLSQSLYLRLDANHSLELVPIRELPLLFESLAHSLQSDHHDVRFEILPVDLTDASERERAVKRHAKAGMCPVVGSVCCEDSCEGFPALTDEWWAGVNTSMLWTIMFSILPRYAVAQLKLALQTDGLFIDADAKTNTDIRDNVHAFFTLRFVCLAALDVEDTEQLELAVDYLIKCFGGDIEVINYQQCTCLFALFLQ
jgi:hypothetical protein